jgi:hypothetical protein
MVIRVIRPFILSYNFLKDDIERNVSGIQSLLVTLIFIASSRAREFLDVALV